MYKGDFMKGAIIPFEFSIADATGAAANPSDAFEAADLVLYKGTGTTERASTAGFAITSTFDSKTGLVSGYVSTGDNTDAGFFTIGDEYKLGLVPDTETVDSLAVSAWVLRFSLQRATSMKPVAGLAVSGTTGKVKLPATASTVDGDYKGAFVRIKHLATGRTECRFQGTTAYDGTNQEITFDSAMDETVAAGDEVEVFLLPVAAVSNVPNVQVADSVRQLIAQEVMRTLYFLRGNKWEVDGAESVLYATDGTTEIGRVPYERLSSPANPVGLVGGA